MPKSKHRKNHKQKVRARNAKVKEKQNIDNKKLQEYYKQLFKEFEKANQGTNALPTVRMPQEDQTQTQMLSEEDIQQALNNTTDNQEENESS